MELLIIYVFIYHPELTSKCPILREAASVALGALTFAELFEISTARRDRERYATRFLRK